MGEGVTYYPPRRAGLVANLTVLVILGLFGAAGLWRAAHASIGPSFLLYLLPTLLAVVVIPLLTYRIYALWVASYHLERDGIRLRWGLRYEDIPMDQVQWVLPLSDVGLMLPWLRWPGAILGNIRHPYLGRVEFQAASAGELIIIALAQQAFAISPADPAAFLKTYQRYTELGSLTPIPSRSVYPSLAINRVWADRPARLLLLADLLVSMILLAWISLAVPGLASASQGSQPVQPLRLLLLPVLNSFIFLADFLIGLFLFRKNDAPLPALPSGQTLAYLVWSGGVFTALLFLISAYSLLYPI